MGWRSRSTLAVETPVDTPQKGSWKDRSSLDAPAAPAEDPGVLSQAWSKLKAAPGALLDTAKDAAKFGNRVVHGDVGVDEGLERLGTAARGAADTVVGIPDAVTRGVNNAIGLPHLDANPKPTGQLLQDTGLQDKASSEAADSKYPGARMLGQVAPSFAANPSSILGIAGTAGATSAAIQAGNTGKIDPKEVASDTLVGAAVPAAIKVAKVGAYGARMGLGAGLDAGAEGIASLKGDRALAEKFTQNPENFETTRTANTSLRDLKNQRPGLANDAEQRATDIVSQAEARKNALYDKAFKDPQINSPVAAGDAHFNDAETTVGNLADDPHIVAHYPSVAKELKNVLEQPSTQAIKDLRSDPRIDPHSSTITVGDNINRIKELRSKLQEQYGDLAADRTPEGRSARRQISDSVGQLSQHLDDAASDLTPEGSQAFRDANQQARTLFSSQKVQGKNTIRKDLDLNQKPQQFQDASKIDSLSKSPSTDRTQRVEQSFQQLDPTGEQAPILKDLQDNTQQQRDIHQTKAEQGQLSNIGISYKGVGLNPVTLGKAADMVASPKLSAYLKAIGRDPLKQLNSSDVGSLSRLTGLTVGEIHNQLAGAGVPVIDSTTQPPQ